MASQKRIQKEFMDIQKSPIDYIEIEVSEQDLYLWKGVLAGPISSPFENGKFNFEIKFPNDFPFKVPEFKFLTKLYHPNVDDDGSICLALLKTENWKPATKITSILLAMTDLLCNPNPDDALRSDVAQLYKTDKQQYNKHAKDWVKKYAS